MLKIRLTRVGKKNSPAYRVVVADQRKAVKRKFIEIIGHYNPTTDPRTLKIDKDKALYWIGNGAQASDTVHNLMCDLEIFPKTDKIKKIYGKKTKKKDEGKEPEEKKIENSEEKIENDAPAENNDNPTSPEASRGADAEATDADAEEPASEETPATETEETPVESPEATEETVATVEPAADAEETVEPAVE